MYVRIHLAPLDKVYHDLNHFFQCGVPQVDQDQQDKGDGKA